MNETKTMNIKEVILSVTETNMQSHRCYLMAGMLIECLTE